MKLLGAILIIVVCWLSGVDFQKTNKQKLDFTRGLFDGIDFLKSEIVYSCDFLGDSIIKSSEFSGEASAFMGFIGVQLREKGMSTEYAFEQAGALICDKVSKEAYILTKDLFCQLGEKDCENQEKMLEGYLKKLDVLIKKQNDFCEKECVMIKKTSAIAGIGLAVLFI